MNRKRFCGCLRFRKRFFHGGFHLSGVNAVAVDVDQPVRTAAYRITPASVPLSKIAADVPALPLERYKRLTLPLGNITAEERQHHAEDPLVRGFFACVCDEDGFCAGKRASDRCVVHGTVYPIKAGGMPKFARPVYIHGIETLTVNLRNDLAPDIDDPKRKTVLLLEDMRKRRRHKGGRYAAADKIGEERTRIPRQHR